MQKYIDVASKERRHRELETEIAQRERAIVTLARQQESEIARLRDSKRYASNNLAGATWEQSLSTEMGAVAERYRTRIEIEQAAITRLSSQLGKLEQ